MFLKISQNSQENTYARVALLKMTQVFSFEFCKIFKSTIFTEDLRWLLQYIPPKTKRKPKFSNNCTGHRKILFA